VIHLVDERGLIICFERAIKINNLFSIGKAAGPVVEALLMVLR
jgi:hypothetical protein